MTCQRWLGPSRYAASAVLCLVLPACTVPKLAAYDQIQGGMTRQEVEAILGPGKELPEASEYYEVAEERLLKPDGGHGSETTNDDHETVRVEYQSYGYEDIDPAPGRPDSGRYLTAALYWVQGDQTTVVAFVERPDGKKSRCGAGIVKGKLKGLRFRQHRPRPGPAGW